MLDYDYIPVSISTLVPDACVGLDLFNKEESSGRYVLYLGSDYPLQKDDLDKLRGRGVNRLYIAKTARERYQDYLREVVDNDSLDTPMAARVGAMNEVVLDVLETSFANRDTDDTVDAAHQLGSLAADIICRDTFAASDLFRVLHHDYATFTHTANVAFFCGILAAELGMSQDEVELVTVGGLLHDLGKLEISEDLLTKPSRLDDQEYRAIQTHTLRGFRQLARRDDLNWGQLMMVYQHHERIDGCGYPVGLVGSEIHDWGKICAVVDVFEALTSHRPYRKPMPRRKALELQHRESGTHFDPEILRCWTSIIQRSLPKSSA